MAGMAKARVTKEVQEVLKDKQVSGTVVKALIMLPHFPPCAASPIQASAIKLEFVDKRDVTHLWGEIPGPPDSPFEGGTFKLEINIPQSYPFTPPKVKFVTRIWHPNISSQTGMICLDILKDQWAAAMTLRTVLLSIQALLSAAEPDDPQDAVVAAQYKKDMKLYEKTAAHWTAAYAGASAGSAGDEESSLLAMVMGMGFPEAQARDALSSKDWNVERAIEYLCS